jgi:hypothetical protein
MNALITYVLLFLLIDTPRPPAGVQEAVAEARRALGGTGGRYGAAVAAIADSEARRRQAGGRSSNRGTRNGTSNNRTTRRGAQFREAEIMSFLELALEYLPISGEEWDDIALEHGLNAAYEPLNRTGQSLRRKFMDLYNKKVPTGDPHMPETVKLAKKIRYKIEERADAAANVEVTDADLGIAPEDADADTSAPAAAASAGAGRTPRPLVSSTPRNRNSNTNDLVSMMMTSMVERQQRSEEEREERRVQQQQQQQQQTMMMMAMMRSMTGGNERMPSTDAGEAEAHGSGARRGDNS